MASTAVDPMTQGAMASQYINPKNDAEQCFQDGSSMMFFFLFVLCILDVSDFSALF